MPRLYLISTEEDEQCGQIKSVGASGGVGRGGAAEEVLLSLI